MKTSSCRVVIGLVALLCCTSALHSARSAEPTTPREFVQRGSEQFFAGRIDESIRSFEQAAKLRPDLKPHLWQLGIAYYFAGRYADGRNLFEKHQKVNSEDVENAVWHFLCVTRLENIEAARKKFIKITRDTRVPMKQIHSLFAGKGTVEQVLAAANAESDPAEKKNALCYAYLYLALFEEARSDAAKSLEYIRKAAGEYSQDHYMGKVARVHAALRGDKKKK